MRFKSNLFWGLILSVLLAGCKEKLTFKNATINYREGFGMPTKSIPFTETNGAGIYRDPGGKIQLVSVPNPATTNWQQCPWLASDFEVPEIDFGIELDQNEVVILNQRANPQVSKGFELKGASTLLLTQTPGGGVKSIYIEESDCISKANRIILDEPWHQFLYKEQDGLGISIETSSTGIGCVVEIDPLIHEDSFTVARHKMLPGHSGLHIRKIEPQLRFPDSMGNPPQPPVIDLSNLLLDGCPGFKIPTPAVTPPIIQGEECWVFDFNSGISGPLDEWLATNNSSLLDFDTSNWIQIGIFDPSQIEVYHCEDYLIFKSNSTGNECKVSLKSCGYRLFRAGNKGVIQASPDCPSNRITPFCAFIN